MLIKSLTSSIKCNWGIDNAADKLDEAIDQISETAEGINLDEISGEKISKNINDSKSNAGLTIPTADNPIDDFILNKTEKITDGMENINNKNTTAGSSLAGGDDNNGVSENARIRKDVSGKETNETANSNKGINSGDSDSIENINQAAILSNLSDEFV